MANTASETTTVIAESADNVMLPLFDIVQQALPRLAVSAILLLLGWLVAALLRAAIVRLARGLNQVISRMGSSNTAARLHVSDTAADTFGSIVFWAVLLLFVTIAAESAGFTRVSGWLENIITFFPTIFAGGLIILVGYLLSRIVRELIASTLSAVGSSHGQDLGKMAQVLIIVLALLTGVQQIGIDVSVLVAITVTTIGAIVGGFALAFALGGRDLLANMIGAFELQRHYRVGQRIRISQREGTIVAFTPTTVMLAGSNGRYAVPAKEFQSKIIELIEDTPSHGTQGPSEPSVS
tara:strand:+ start:311 stop:1195 length:885 start_codon:yes stop_codon:yes gene_type:complete